MPCNTIPYPLWRRKTCVFVSWKFSKTQLNIESSEGRVVCLCDSKTCTQSSGVQHNRQFSCLRRISIICFSAKWTIFTKHENIWKPTKYVKRVYLKHNTYLTFDIISRVSSTKKNMLQHCTVLLALYWIQALCQNGSPRGINIAIPCLQSKILDKC